MVTTTWGAREGGTEKERKQQLEKCRNGLIKKAQHRGNKKRTRWTRWNTQKGHKVSLSRPGNCKDQRKQNRPATHAPIPTERQTHNRDIMEARDKIVTW